jgi:anti-anti-sigma factor
MGALERTQFHKLFLADLVGETLVVTPHGDSVGFRDTDVAGELTTLLSLADSPGVKNLVVDLESSKYFGSTVIAALTQLGARFRERNARIAMCNASPEMAGILQVMHLNEMWMNFDSRKIALRAMAKV